MIARQRLRHRTSRYSAMGGPAALPTYPRDETIHQMSREAPHYLSSEQAGYIISQQHHNKNVHPTPRHPHRRPITPREAEQAWTVSTLYKLMKVPSWVISPYRRIRPDDPSYSSGPIIVDLNNGRLTRYMGSLLQDINICVIDGKHRLAEFKREHGDDEIDAFVGTEALGELRRWLEEYAVPRKEFVDALETYYSNMGQREAWHELIAAGRSIGFRDGQLRTLWQHASHGWLYSPSEGRFVRNDHEE